MLVLDTHADIIFICGAESVPGCMIQYEMATDPFLALRTSNDEIDFTGR